MKKRCSACKELKDLSLFVRDNSSFDGVARICRQCKNEYYFKNKDKISQRRKISYEKNKILISEKIKEFNKTHRGKIMLTMSHIKQRCENKNNPRYHRYGGRGIRNLLTYQDIEYLWKRDHAELMKQPSIDRINNDGNYELSNCQFIEWTHNASKDVFKRKINQINIDGTVVKTWCSLAEAGRAGFMPQNIMKCCKGKRKKHGGFRWEYVS